MSELKLYNKKTFDDIKHIDESGNEYWLARELQLALDYKKWQKFINVIENAKVACEQSKFIIEDHFTQVGKMIKIAKGAKRKIDDYKLSRYACYLIVQNLNPKKEVVALGQTYFAIQTRRHELTEKEYDYLKPQFQTSKVGSRKGHIVFTEQSVAIIATILKSKIIVKPSTTIMDAFVNIKK